MKWAINPNVKPAVYWHIFPTKTEAKDAIWRDPNMLFNIVPAELIERKNEVEMVIYFKNGSVYQLKGADDPDALRGAGPFGVVFDEFEKIKYYAWEVVEPILRANGGWAWFLGTPIGRNHFYDFYIRGQGNNPEWKSYLLKASESNVIPEHELEETKRTSTHDTWAQEYECEFLQGEGEVFRGVKDVMTSVPEKPQLNELYTMGVDLAKTTDWTVIRVYKNSDHSLVYSDRFQQLEWPFQKAKIKAVADLYNHAMVYLDATGLGDPIADDLMRSFVSVEPIKITEPLKKELVEKLSIWIQQKRIKMLYQEYALFEYENFTYSRGPTGKIRYGAREGYHDDVVMADALAIHGLAPLPREINAPEPTYTQIAYRRALNKYENEHDTDSGDGFNQWETPTEDLY